jgi:hypothetical protein
MIASTDASGVARTEATVPDHGKSQQVVARYAGNETYAPSETSATITWGRAKS